MILLGRLWSTAWQSFEILCVSAWALVLILMLLPKRKFRAMDPGPVIEGIAANEPDRVVEVGGPGHESFLGAVPQRRSDASSGVRPGKPELPPQDEGFA